MKRYSNIQIGSRYDGKRVYRSTTYPTIPLSTNDLVIVSNDSDYLDTLAYKYYGDPTLYWIIACANNIGKGRMSVPPGMSLRIPTNVNQIVSAFNKLNS